jgi:hydrogenase 3 maturation protease
MPTLADTLAGLARGRTVCVVGVGNPLRGDDGAGPLVVERLGGHDGVRLIDAGTTPENWYGPLLAHGPALVVFVDAADHGGAPGECVLAAADTMAARDGGTHAPTLKLLAHLLAPRGVDSWFVGIQPARTATGAPLHPAVGAAVDEVAAALSGVVHAEAGHA